VNEISIKQRAKNNMKIIEYIETVGAHQENAPPTSDHIAYADAAAAWELTYKAQMAEAGLHVETVGEGIAILLQVFNERKASVSG